MLTDKNNPSPNVEGTRDEDALVDVWSHVIGNNKKLGDQKQNQSGTHRRMTRETRFRWFSYKKGQNVEAPIKRYEMIYLPECRRLGR